MIEDMEGEIWKDVVGFEGLYTVSNMGRVKSSEKIVRYRWGERVNKARILKPNNLDQRYDQVTLCRNKYQKKITVHRLVVITFLDMDATKNSINHKDGNKRNNCASNLEWCTQKENIDHAYKLGLMHGRKGEKHPNSLLTNDNVAQMKAMLKDGARTRDLVKIFNVSEDVIYQIKVGNSWKHI